mmetsp:Transcript_14015/g.34549  ORF Transcript_14015/g.34549 Transcript_14015/m.34549 type:complete len:618 (-) Transcript_14015:1777-3630(-)|eukprot:CAMPEP_0202866016 /NCGR_PEP_ID=MMETSP1391-20130828/7026_1 /ASSEMBLY_ACC=CAM_ASM_000867 /TAXON_ID=1034604 /ORGANISM="Chlamydomonas leiostraca, Strain SAG 11-49" /LENGTH=617 /DNA_ID=CAMNT_0049545921 /DNA_START=80 /DNA_END=1933 /DNA_ORIENTATION=+
MDTGSDSVLGHFSCSGSGPLQPLLVESSPLFVALVEDNAPAVQAAIDGDPTAVSRLHLVLHWSSEAAPEGEGEKRSRTLVKQRSLLQVASLCGSAKVVRLLLDAGANPQQLSPDGVSAIQFAQQAAPSSAQASILAMLQAAETRAVPAAVSAGSAGGADLGLPMSSQANGSIRSNASPYGDGDLAQAAGAVPSSFGLVDAQIAQLMHPQGDVDIDNPFHQPEGLPYSTSELTQPEFSTDDWRMFGFKVMRCSKRFAHDWRACPFAHPTENARRRDPREFRYCAIACPDYKQGFCVRGDACPYAHGVFECWLHPSRYRTQLCKDGANCHRPICFFAHSLPELRTPTHTWTPSPEDLLVSRSSSGTLNNSSSQAAAAAADPVAKYNPGHNSAGARHMDPAAAAGMAAAPAPGANSAAVFGFTAPRMSNAFARRHGLNPKDNAMLNLQKIALQAQALTPPGPQQHGMDGTGMGMGGGGAGYMAAGPMPRGVHMNGHMGGAYPGHMPGGASGRGMGQAMAMAAAANRKQQQQYHSQGQQQGHMMQPHAYNNPYQQNSALGSMQGGSADPSALAALNNHLAALSLQQPGFGGGHGGAGQMGGMQYGAPYGQHAMAAGDGAGR